jgi:Plasmid pRiA4b ORF-3-like protein
MPELASSPVPSVHQLRVVLRGVSPLIWRRLLVPATTTIADLHAVLQAAFGWADEHLHRFVIHGREYGISYPGGVGFRDNPRRISLAGFGLRAGERFVYDYDFIDGWRHDIRVEQLVRAGPLADTDRDVTHQVPWGDHGIIPGAQPSGTPPPPTAGAVGSGGCPRLPS